MTGAVHHCCASEVRYDPRAVIFVVGICGVGKVVGEVVIRGAKVGHVKPVELVAPPVDGASLGEVAAAAPGSLAAEMLDKHPPPPSGSEDESIPGS